MGEYELSLRFLEKALALNIRYYGAKSLKVAVSFHLVARTQSCMGDFRSALNNEKETYAIYKQQVEHIYFTIFRMNCIKLQDCVIDQAVGYHLLTIKSQNNFQWRSGEVGSGQIATAAGFSLSTSVFTFQ